MPSLVVIEGIGDGLGDGNRIRRRKRFFEGLIELMICLPLALLFCIGRFICDVLWHDLTIN